MPKFLSYARLFAFQIAFLAIARFLGLMSESGKSDWYLSLTKSAFSPPGWVFGVVWTGLYLMLGYVGWWLWEHRGQREDTRLAGILFAVQMAMNWAWTPLFFQLHLLWLSFFWIVAMIPLLFAIMSLVGRSSRLCAWLLAPNVAWLAFAAYLSGTIAFLN